MKVTNLEKFLGSKKRIVLLSDKIFSFPREINLITQTETYPDGQERSSGIDVEIKFGRKLKNEKRYRLVLERIGK